MTETVSSAVAAQDTSPGALIAQYSKDFSRVLPEHIRAETFVRLAQGVLRRNPQLADHAQANPRAFLAALLECARLGHAPGTESFAIVPFKDHGQKTIVGIEQYQGEIERMYRAGAVASVKAAVVRSNDYYQYSETSTEPPDFRPGWYYGTPPGQQRHARFMSEADRGQLVGVFAYAVFHHGGISRVVEMSHDEVMKHKAVSKGAEGADSPWQKWEASMWLKTAVHELEKWVPTSAEYRREMLRAGAEADRIRATMGTPDPATVDLTTGEILDAEIVGEGNQ